MLHRYPRNLLRRALLTHYHRKKRRSIRKLSACCVQSTPESCESDLPAPPSLFPWCIRACIRNISRDIHCLPHLRIIRLYKLVDMLSTLVQALWREVATVLKCGECTFSWQSITDMEFLSPRPSEVPGSTPKILHSVMITFCSD